MEQYGIIEIAGADFEDAALKNHWIAGSKEPVLIFVNRDVAAGEEIVQMLEDFPYMEQTDLLVLCAHAPKTADWYDILMDLELEVYAMVVRRTLFALSSCFNFRLSDETNREFLCRAAEVCEAVFLECSDVNWSRKLTEQIFQTNAYLLTRYLQPLKMKGFMETALEAFVTFAQSYGCRELFSQCLSRMLAEDESYQKIYLATAPFFVIRGSDICYGVLQGFADQLTEALKRQGQRVVETGGGDSIEDGSQIHLLQTERFRGVIGFQATVLFQEVFDFVEGRRFNFWFDHPMFFHGLFEGANRPMTFLCQDMDHADYLNACFSNAKGIQFPPGGAVSPWCDGEKPYEISFMGTCFDEQGMWEVVGKQDGIMRELSETCIELLLEHGDMSYNELKKVLEQMYPEVFAGCPFVVIANQIWEATRIAPYMYRRRVIEKILSAGYELHVYGESWKDYPVKEGERLVIHERVKPEDMAAEMRKSKISLNVMSWHKAGMTERIIEIMMSGSVCLTDETRYLKEHFSQLEDIVMFRLDELEVLPDLIGRILSDEQKRAAIAARAYQRAVSEHTWDVRAGQLIALVDEMEE